MKIFINLFEKVFMSFSKLDGSLTKRLKNKMKMSSQISLILKILKSFSHFLVSKLLALSSKTFLTKNMNIHYTPSSKIWNSMFIINSFTVTSFNSSSSATMNNYQGCCKKYVNF